MFGLYNMCVLTGDISYLNTMKEKYEYNHLTLRAQKIMGEDVDWSKVKRLEKKVYESENIVEVPTEFSLLPAYPNPFNPSTTISFSLPEQTKIDIRVYDLQGSEVWSYDNNLEFGTGNHRVVWNAVDDSGNSLPSGVYFIKVMTNTNLATQKVVLMK